MTIFIKHELRVQPAAVQLPAWIDLCVTLRSDRESEEVTLFHRLATDHCVWFAGADTKDTKTWSSVHVVGRAAVELCTAVRLIKHPGPDVGSLSIELTIKGKDNEDSSRCRLTALTRGA